MNVMTTISGKIYFLWGQYKTKREAKSAAKSARSGGDSARIVQSKSKGVWQVWRRTSAWRRGR